MADTRSGDQQVNLRNLALGLLARREHSREELQQKLTRKLPSEMDADIIPPLLDKLIEQGLLSDPRFTEAYVNMRARKGYGPVRIAMELSEKGIDAELAQFYLEERDDWSELLAQTWRKKFHRAPVDYADKVRQMRFLQFRGYTMDSIRNLLDGG